jgi:hypothetical protein
MRKWLAVAPQLDVEGDRGQLPAVLSEIAQVLVKLFVVHPVIGPGEVPDLDGVLEVTPHATHTPRLERGSPV